MNPVTRGARARLRWFWSPAASSAIGPYRRWRVRADAGEASESTSAEMPRSRQKLLTQRRRTVGSPARGLLRGELIARSAQSIQTGSRHFGQPSIAERKRFGGERGRGPPRRCKGASQANVAQRPATKGDMTDDAHAVQRLSLPSLFAPARQLHGIRA